MNVSVCGAEWPNFSVTQESLQSIQTEVSLRDDGGEPSRGRVTECILLTLESILPKLAALSTQALKVSRE